MDIHADVSKWRPSTFPAIGSCKVSARLSTSTSRTSSALPAMPLLGQAQPALRSQRVESYGNLPPYLHPACRLGQQRNLPERRRSARSGILLPQRQICRHEQRFQDSRTLQRHFPCPQRRERDCHTGAPLLRRQLSGVPGLLAHQRHRTGHLHVCPTANTPDGLQGGDSWTEITATES